MGVTLGGCATKRFTAVIDDFVFFGYTRACCIQIVNYSCKCYIAQPHSVNHLKLYYTLHLKLLCFIQVAD